MGHSQPARWVLGVVLIAAAVLISRTTEMAVGGCNYGYWGGGVQTAMACGADVWVALSAATIAAAAAIILWAAWRGPLGAPLGTVPILLLGVALIWTALALLWLIAGDPLGGGARYKVLVLAIMGTPAIAAGSVAWMLHRDRSSAAGLALRAASSRTAR